ncbi:hypothetical protein PIB30_007757 [Stylosanthes scabra]|uniref:Disease resistance protein At4g27190-like leucine-rich repeats domain-containing protein n=1 Tax=Stylosanthes scabra TaxID=79078 RepID=A0ABU6Y305_9FABA|nr:hypothetical protein [Stylosanthes scabra]
MQIESRHIVGSSTGYDYRRDNLEELRLSEQKNTDVMNSFLHCNPNLKSLCLLDCSFAKLEPDGTRRPAVGVVPKLKSLTLTNSYLKNIFFEQDAVLQKIESLIINSSSGLDTIVPLSVSLAHLTILEIVGCSSRGLNYMISASIANSLGQLKTMKVIGCESLVEIVSEETREGEEEKQNVGTPVPIIFKQLTTLELVSLESLNSFCGSKNCGFEFPSLENLIVSGCPNMEVFSAPEVHCAPNLQKIYYVHHKDKKRWCWKDNINSTIKFYEGMHELFVSSSRDDDPLKSIWLSKEGPRKDWFSCVETLRLYDASLKYAVPSNVLRCLKSLQELQVEMCNKIKCIFEMDDTKSRGSSFQLKKLTLSQLSNLKSVWQHDKSEILLGFQNLQHVSIDDCEKLTSVFPTSLARDLKKLEELKISGCAELKEIVGKEEEAVEGLDKFVFPHLTTLLLSELPQLTDFNSGNFTLEFPELKKLCLFPNQQQKYPEGISKGKELWLNPNHSLALQFMNQSGFHHYLDDDDDGEKSSLPIDEILADEKTPPNLEIIEIRYNKHCKTINIPEEAGKRMLRLKELYLWSLSELDSISGLQYLLKLQLLFVVDCPKLTSLGQSCSNLKELYIRECSELEFLFTTAAAKMLIHLEELRVARCSSLKEIVGKEQESVTEDIVEFKRLHRLTLKKLDSLKCFYSGNATLKFPSLIRLDIKDCPDMEIFSQGAIHMEPSRPPFKFFFEDSWLFIDDLNLAATCQFRLPKPSGNQGVFTGRSAFSRVVSNAESDRDSGRFTVQPRCFYSLGTRVRNPSLPFWRIFILERKPIGRLSQERFLMLNRTVTLAGSRFNQGVFILQGQGFEIQVSHFGEFSSWRENRPGSGSVRPTGLSVRFRLSQERFIMLNRTVTLAGSQFDRLVRSGFQNYG